MPNLGYIPWAPAISNLNPAPTYGALTPTGIPRGSEPFAPAAGSVGGGYGGLPAYTFGGAGSGAIPGTYSAASGGIPNPPTAGQSAGTALQVGQNVLPGYLNLAGQLSGGQQGMLLSQLESALPGAGAARALNMGNISSMLKGELSPYTIANIVNMAASRGVAAGTPGSPVTEAGIQEAIGNDSQMLELQAAQMLNQAQANAPVVSPLPFPYYGVSSEQQAANDLLKAIYGSAPIPQAAQDQMMRMLQAGMNRGYNMGYGAGPMYPTYNPLSSMLGSYGSNLGLPSGTFQTSPISSALTAEDLSSQYPELGLGWAPSNATPTMLDAELQNWYNYIDQTPEMDFADVQYALEY